MSNWKIVTPLTTVNQVLNPSAEIVGNFAAGPAGGGVTRVTTTAWSGIYSYRLAAAGALGDIDLTLNVLANAIHYVTIRTSYDAVPPTWQASLDGVPTWNNMVLLENYGSVAPSGFTWQLWGVAIPAAQANGSVLLSLQILGLVAEAFVDAVQVEALPAWTTYCDGDQTGCEWLGIAHGSQSQRSAVSRAGGYLGDIQDDYNFDIEAMQGAGMPPLDLSVDSYALLPGGQLNSLKVLPRQFALLGTVNSELTAATIAQVHANRQELIYALKHDLVPETMLGIQPLTLRYEGATVHKQIKAYYLSGLELNLNATIQCWEPNIPLAFLAPDPNWYEIGESASVLDSNDTATLRYITGRLRATGQWDDLGLANNPAANGSIFTVLVASDQSIYVGGLFTGMNNVAGRDMVARYIPSTDTWQTVGGAGDFTADIVKLIEGPDGTIYASGSFSVAGGSVADYIAQWNGAAWAPVGVPVAGAANIAVAWDMVFDRAGDLYIVGQFINWAGIAAADGVVRWGGLGYTAVGAPAILITEQVNAVAVNSQDDIYIGGLFATAAGIALANNIAFWDGVAWNTLGAGGGINNQVLDLIFDIDDILFLCGLFTNAGTDANADFIAQWNGQGYSALSTQPPNAQVRSLALGPDRMLYIAGSFITIGGITLADSAAKWNGSAWAHLDLDLPGAGANAIALGPVDPVVATNYDVWVGFSNTGAGTFAGDTIVVNAGTKEVFPTIVISRTGGTDATLKEVRNETTGKELLFDYALLDGEILTINLEPTEKSIVSNFFGIRPDAIFAGSDFGEWALLPGNNLVTCFVDVAGGPTVLAYLVWQDTYWSVD